MPAQAARRFDQIIEIAVQLRRAAGDIESRNVASSKKAQHRVDILPAHHLLARRPGFDMAVNARQVAVAPKIHLQDIDGAALEAVAVRCSLSAKGCMAGFYEFVRLNFLLLNFAC